MTDQERADLFKTTIAYGGTYTYDGKTVTHHLDIYWNEIWTGTDLVREVKFEGKRLTLITIPGPASQDGKIGISVLTWERIK
jgi:Lipocalin-like domain